MPAGQKRKVNDIKPLNKAREGGSRRASKEGNVRVSKNC